MYVERKPEPEPEPEPERLSSSAPLPDSPLVVAAEEHRTERETADVELETVKAPRVVHAPTPTAAVVIRSELPPSQRLHDRRWYERAAERCERRATEWARNRCLREVAKR